MLPAEGPTPPERRSFAILPSMLYHRLVSHKFSSNHHTFTYLAPSFHNVGCSKQASSHERSLHSAQLIQYSIPIHPTPASNPLHSIDFSAETWCSQTANVYNQHTQPATQHQAMLVTSMQNTARNRSTHGLKAKSMANMQWQARAKTLRYVPSAFLFDRCFENKSL